MLRAQEVLRLYDTEMRQDPVVDPGFRAEKLGPIVRVVGRENYIIFSDLDDRKAREVVTEQVEYFRRSGGSVEWKVFGHDQPGNLETILSAAGFVPDPPETLIAFDLREGLPEGMVTVGIDFRRVTDDAGIHDAVAANVAAFGPEAQDRAMAYEQRLRAPNQAVVVAYAEGAPIASGRVDLPPGRSFAGLWGGGTAPAYRHRGVYRGLVHERAVLARNAGYHYLTADALETSRPILERLGFVPLTTTRGWILEAGPGPSVG
ncbi:MAG: GNAT family N-acetyltransferase [Thermoplasmata archaeon]|jgi:GNAT superfamily N-acetyltransferase